MTTLFTFKNLLIAYFDARKYKRNTINALNFEFCYEMKLFDLLDELIARTYKPWKSICFIVERPVIREIFASDFRDRVVHHLYVRFLEKYTESKLIYDSYACRKNKWTLRASTRLLDFLSKISRKKEKYYYLKMDISWFFMSINQDILYKLMIKHINKIDIDSSIRDELIYLSEVIIYHNPTENYIKKWDISLFEKVPKRKSLFYTKKWVGIPIGNLTSQFFANIYLNELDIFIKHELRVKYYLRYVDDFVILWDSSQDLHNKMLQIDNFLKEKLSLSLHDKKTIIQPVANWIKFIGYLHKYNKRIALKKHINSTKECLKQKPINYNKLASYNWYFKQTDNRKIKKYLSDFFD